MSLTLKITSTLWVLSIFATLVALYLNVSDRWLNISLISTAICGAAWLVSIIWDL